MSENDFDRRAFLGAVGGVTVAAVAGCTGAPPTASNQTGGDDETGGGSHGDEHREEDSHGETEDHHEADQHHEVTTTEDHHEADEHHTEEAPHEEGGHGVDGPSDHAEVKMQTLDSGHHFHPHVAWVTPGGTVTFHNVSGTHTATAYHPNNGKPRRVPEGVEPFDSGILSEAGATFEHTFEKEGVYDIYCEPHETVGMIGSIVVGKPDPHSQPGLAEPGSEMPERAGSKIRQLNEQVNTMLGHEH